MIGAMPLLRRTTAAFLASVLLTACQGSPSGTPPPATTEPADPGVEVAPSRPHFAGRLAVQVQSGLIRVGETTCAPAPNRVCSSDGTRSWVPIKEAGEATLIEATTRLADQHTSWTTVLRFDRTSRPALARASADAGAAGGVILLVKDGRAVADVAPLDLHWTRATFTNLTKSEAWDLVVSVSPGAGRG
jgi:hypothetical protein